MKTIVVTGANSGIGRSITEQLLQSKNKVVMVVRDTDKSREVFEDLKSKFGAENLQMEFCDLADLTNVKNLADRLNKFERINVLINNAGLEMAQRHESAQGFEMTLAVNYLAPFYLTKMLLPKLLQHKGSRIVNTSSLVEKWGNIDFEDMQMINSYDPEKAYYRSKLALLLFTYELSRKYSPDQITVNAFEPGMTKTDFSRDFQGIMKYGSMFMKLFMHSADVPAKTAVYLALSDEVSKVTGKNFEDMKEKISSETSRDKFLAKKLSEVTEKMLQAKLKNID